jgi:hypothetical protein
MKTILSGLLIMLACLNSSCYIISKSKYKLDRDFNFKNKEEYVKFLKKEKAFPIEKVLYLDASSYNEYLMELTRNNQESAIIYRGTYLNDSVQIKHNEFLQENESCYGRIEDQIQSNILLRKVPDSLLIKEKKLSQFKLLHLNNNEPFDMSREINQYNVFLGSIHKAGTYYRSFYKRMIALQKKNSFVMNLYIILLDPVYKLK